MIPRDALREVDDVHGMVQCYMLPHFTASNYLREHPGDIHRGENLRR